MSAQSKQAQEAAEMALVAREALDSAKAQNIIQLEVTELSVLADHFILCTGNAEPHLKALAERVKREVSKKYNFKPRVDGVASSGWIVVDFGAVVVHILSAAMRELYQLESLWEDAPSIEHIEKLAKAAPKK